jgi:hypothetical protein
MGKRANGANRPGLVRGVRPEGWTTAGPGTNRNREVSARSKPNRKPALRSYRQITCFTCMACRRRAIEANSAGVRAASISAVVRRDRRSSVEFGTIEANFREGRSGERREDETAEKTARSKPISRGGSVSATAQRKPLARNRLETAAYVRDG